MLERDEERDGVHSCVCDAVMEGEWDAVHVCDALKVYTALRREEHAYRRISEVAAGFCKPTAVIEIVGVHDEPSELTPSRMMQGFVGARASREGRVNHVLSKALKALLKPGHE